MWFFKREKTQAQENSERDGHDGNEQDLSIIETYKLLLKIFKLPVIRWTVVVLLTCKVTLSILGFHLSVLFSPFYHLDRIFSVRCSFRS